MGDIRFTRALERVAAAPDRRAALQAMSTDDLIMALAASSPDREPLLVNVMATELQNRAQRSLAVAEHIAEGVAIVDDVDVITFLNPSAEGLLGRRAADVVGRPAALLRLRDRAGADIPPEERPSWRARALGEVASRHDLLLERADGTWMPAAILAAPIRSEGAIIGAVVTVRDVTAQRRLEDDLRIHKLLLDAVGEAVVATSPDGRILYWNLAAEALYGWLADEVLGRDVVDVTPTDASRADAEGIMRRLERGESWAGVFPTRRKDGSVFLARVTNRPVLDETGRLVAVIGISQPDALEGKEERAGPLGSAK
jgi:PAS domain S-box-containing protein